MDRNVDFPQPDGPDTDTYWPRSMSTVTSRKATAGSSASPSKVRVTPSSRISGRSAAGAVSDVDRASRFHHPMVTLPADWTSQADGMLATRERPKKTTKLTKARRHEGGLSAGHRS